MISYLIAKIFIDKDHVHYSFLFPNHKRIQKEIIKRKPIKEKDYS